MVLDAADWEAADPTSDVITQVRDVLTDDETKAYCVDDFFRDAGPESEGFEPLATLLEALDWQVSKQRSEVLVEMALETLVSRDVAEKRVRQEDGDAVAYYRAA